MKRKRKSKKQLLIFVKPFLTIFLLPEAVYYCQFSSNLSQLFCLPPLTKKLKNEEESNV
jgi:hypothetical protein